MSCCSPSSNRPSSPSAGYSGGTHDIEQAAIQEADVVEADVEEDAGPRPVRDIARRFGELGRIGAAAAQRVGREEGDMGAQRRLIGR